MVTNLLMAGSREHLGTGSVTDDFAGSQGARAFRNSRRREGCGAWRAVGPLLGFPPSPMRNGPTAQRLCWGPSGGERWVHSDDLGFC